MTPCSLSVQFIAFEALATLCITECGVHIERAGSACVHSCFTIGVGRTRHTNVGIVVSVRARSARRTDRRSRLGNLQVKQQQMGMKVRINERMKTRSKKKIDFSSMRSCDRETQEPVVGGSLK